MLRSIFTRYLFVILTLALCSIAIAENSDSIAGEDVPDLKPTKINGNAPKIDGYLNDAIWNSPDLQIATDFKQIRPDDGKIMTESTHVAVAYDEEAIYFAFWCYDSEADKIERQMVRRDRFGIADLIAVRLDPYHDHQSGYDFYVNSVGVQCDARLFNDGNSDYAWDAVWESDVKIQPWGWSVEIKIPYYCIRFNEKDVHTWGADFARAINRKNESGRWAHKTIDEAGFASKFGHLTELTGIKPARHMEVLPYAVTNLETVPGDRDYNGNIGLDLKYGISSSLTLDATVNPDFGQVELDQPVLNLSAYETWYPERRPFFIEGSELFSGQYQMFYSRRIGRAPYGHVNDDQFAFYTKYPRATTILGAAKMTGKLSGRTSVAFLTAVTQKEKAEYRAVVAADTTYDGDSAIVSYTYETRKGVVEPQAIYSVWRLKQDIFNYSSVGGVLTIAGQDTRHPALTGAVDWRLITNNNYWAFNGQSIFSRVDNENVGFATDLVLEKLSGKHIRAGCGVIIRDTHFDINRLGYADRNNYRAGWLWVQYRTTDDWWIVRDSYNNINLSASWNYDDYNIGRNWNFNNMIQFVNNWEGGCGISINFGDYDDMETRGLGVWEEPSAWNAWVWLDTEERRKLSFEVDYIWGESRTSPWWSAEFLARYRPVSTMQFMLYTTYTHDFGQLMWTYNANDTSYFADKDQDIFNLSATAEVMINRNLSCQLSAEGLLTGLDYNNYRPYIPHGNYGDALSSYNRDSIFDRNHAALNSTLLIRWEYLPGSTLYAVWTRSRDDVDHSISDLDLSRDFKRLFSGDAYNVFLIKTNYWLNI